ncbi:MAG: hypothetical protein K6G61_00075 [Solobacterium sp.]|nr:hypothetical protein [Solobacterium sp.]
MRFGKTMTAIAAAAVLTVPANAEGKTYEGENGGSVILQNYLVLKENANVPEVTFTYAIAAGSAMNATDTGLAVFAGDDAHAVTGMPVISDAEFETGQQTFADIQKFKDEVNIRKYDSEMNVLDEPFTLEDGMKYARSDIAVDFSGVVFREPGVYRYIVTENASGSTTGIVDDADLTRVLDVYCEHDGATGEVVITGYVLHNSEASAEALRDGTDPAGKSLGFVNAYETHDLTVQLTVSGNQASRDEYFEVPVSITDAMPGAVFDVDLSGCDEVTKLNGINAETHTNPSQLTADENGAVTATLWLQHGQEAKIQGLSANTKYTANENRTTLDQEGYTGNASKVSGDDDVAADQDAVSLSDTVTGITSDTVLLFHNTKDGLVPTGISAGMMPAAGAAAALALLGMLRRKKKNG